VGPEGAQVELATATIFGLPSWAVSQRVEGADCFGGVSSARQLFQPFPHFSTFSNFFNLSTFFNLLRKG
jgi:hypothetical protein